MARGGDGEELGEPLDDAEHHPLEVGHATISRATSSGVVRRPLGLRRRAPARIASWPGIFCSAGVSVTPARIALTAIPRGASSEASWRTCASSAAFAADTGP